MTVERAKGSIAPNEWAQGWSLLIAASICYACSTLPLTAVGYLVTPLGREFGWSRATVTSGLFFTAVGTMIIVPWVGHLVDRLGPRRVGLAGLPFLAASTALIGLTGASEWNWYACWVLFAIAQAFAGAVVWTNAVISRFDRSRGLALALVLTTQSAAYGLMPTFAVLISENFGWRAVLFFQAAFMLLVALPLGWRFVYSASDLRRRANHKVDLAGAGVGFRQIVLTPDFWRIAISFAFAAAAGATLFVHLQPILGDRGMSAQQAASVLIILGPATLLGRLGSGFLLDRFPASRIAAIMLASPALCYAILTFSGDSLILAYLCVAVLGVAGGGESDLLSYLVSRHFPPAAFSRAYGLTLGVFSLGYGITPVMVGLAYDAVGSYQLSFYALIASAIAASLLIATLKNAPSQHGELPFVPAREAS
jgi:predicted MFS family arabinose efflux permease